MKLEMLCALLLLPGATAFANGGPIDLSTSLGSGNICFLEEAEIELRQEQLTIIPTGDWVEIHAVYTLENTGPATVVEYGFPFQVFPNEMEDYYWNSSRETVVSILDGAMPLPVQVHTLPCRMEAPGFYDETVEGSVKWYTTELSFLRGETKTISVHCRVLAFFEDYITSKSFYPGYSSRYFRYLLDPAGYWGCGTADTMHIAIDFSWILANGGEVKAVAGPGEWLSNSLYGGTLQGFTLAGAPGIEFEYDIRRWKLADLIRDLSIPSWLLTDIRVSSELPEQNGHCYGANNLVDADLSTAWVEGTPGDGTGEWIEFSIEEGFNLGSISIVNGYRSARETYEANGRAARIRCILNFADGDTDEFTVDLDDQSWDEISNDPCGGYQLIWETGEPMEVETVRLQILDAYPGSTYDDLCISECILLGYNEGVSNW